MTRKDFVAVAAAINAALAEAKIGHPRSVSVAVPAIINTANKLANVFADANPKFNRNIFLAACGIA